MLKLLQFNGQTVTPKDDSLWNELITEKCGAFIGVDVTSLGSNVIKVTDGRILVKGRQIIITEEDVNVQLSTDGTKKGRLLIHVDLSAETPATFQSQVADELPELVQDDDFNESNGIYEIELAQYDVDVLAVSNFEETIEKIDGVMEILSTEEELMANTQSGRVPDALVVKDINTSLTDKTTWKFHSQATGVDILNLPTEYEEIIVLVIGGDYRYTWNFCNIQLSSTFENYIQGFFASSASTYTQIKVSYSQTQLVTYIQEGVQYTSTAITRVYYH